MSSNTRRFTPLGDLKWTNAALLRSKNDIESLGSSSKNSSGHSDLGFGICGDSIRSAGVVESAGDGGFAGAARRKAHTENVLLRLPFQRNEIVLVR
jgi:hypothetical protein